jgi:hypothetical protein
VLLLVAACATPQYGTRVTDETLVNLACSRFNPSMQTAIAEAVVAAGGPQEVDVAGWMCGREEYGYVRIVLLRYEQDSARAAEELIPAVFEQGRLVTLGWRVLETQPNRYGKSPAPDREHPWRVPEGWCGVFYEDPNGTTKTGHSES